ncbi:MAG: hypothetical protein KGR25_11490, partial [Chloroflexi bacterium]|nr:hypothetical protein [Chloroflexota bacterium]
ATPAAKRVPVRGAGGVAGNGRVASHRLMAPFAGSSRTVAPMGNEGLLCIQPPAYRNQGRRGRRGE